MLSREKFSFFMPVHIHFGIDSIQKVSKVISCFNPEKILLVTGKISARKYGNLKRLTDTLYRQEFFIFDEIDINPTLDVMEKGVEFSKNNRIELVIGLGGGSVLDAGKCIAMMTKQEFSIKTYLEEKMHLDQGIPFIAIPTTSGTGSDVTPWASIWDHQVKRKISIEDSFLFPAVSIIDPTLTLSKPGSLTAVTGLDALCHAVEAYWSKRSNPVSDSFAEQAIQLIVKDLVNAVKSPDVLEYRVNMAKGSLYAGIAFSQTKTTACHAISYPLTAHFKIPHGLACAMTLPSMFEFNAPVIGKKARKLSEWFDAGSVKATPQKIRDIMKSLNVQTRLNKGNIDIDSVFNVDSLTDRIMNNPKEIKKEHVTQIIENIL